MDSVAIGFGIGTMKYEMRPLNIKMDMLNLIPVFFYPQLPYLRPEADILLPKHWSQEHMWADTNADITLGYRSP